MKRRVIIIAAGIGLVGLGGFLAAMRPHPAKVAATDRSSLIVALDILNGHVLQHTVKTTGNAKVTLNIATPLPTPKPYPSASPGPSTNTHTSSTQVSISSSSVQTTTSGSVRIDHHSSSTAGTSTSSNTVNVNITND